MLIPYWSMHLVKKLILVAARMQVSFKPAKNAKFIPEISKKSEFPKFCPGRLIRNPK